MTETTKLSAHGTTVAPEGSAQRLVTPSSQRITPCLWFDNQAEEAAKFYASIFPNSAVGHIAHYGEFSSQASGRPAGSVMTVTFKLDGQEFLGLNGGPVFQFTPAISFMVNCKDQKEIDHYWDKLIEGGAPMECGWLTDKFGLSWQIVPAELGEMMKDPDTRKSERAMGALLKMVKLDAAEIRKAYEQG